MAWHGMPDYKKNKKNKKNKKKEEEEEEENEIIISEPIPCYNLCFPPFGLAVYIVLAGSLGGTRS
jgi:hypothetical protein